MMECVRLPANDTSFEQYKIIVCCSIEVESRAVNLSNRINFLLIDRSEKVKKYSNRSRKAEACGEKMS